MDKDLDSCDICRKTSPAPPKPLVNRLWSCSSWTKPIKTRCEARLFLVQKSPSFTGRKILQQKIARKNPLVGCWPKWWSLILGLPRIFGRRFVWWRFLLVEAANVAPGHLLGCLWSHHQSRRETFAWRFSVASPLDLEEFVFWVLICTLIWRCIAAFPIEHEVFSLQWLVVGSVLIKNGLDRFI